MELEIGVVCARCDRYAPMGTERCAECGTALALALPAGGVGGVAAGVPAAEDALTSKRPPPVMSTRAGDGGEVRRASSPGVIQMDRPPPAPETLVARAGYTDPPPNAFLRSPLVPRRT